MLDRWVTTCSRWESFDQCGLALGRVGVLALQRGEGRLHEHHEVSDGVGEEGVQLHSSCHGSDLDKPLPEDSRSLKETEHPLLPNGRAAVLEDLPDEDQGGRRVRAHQRGPGEGKDGGEGQQQQRSRRRGRLVEGTLGGALQIRGGGAGLNPGGRVAADRSAEAPRGAGR